MIDEYSGVKLGDTLTRQLTDSLRIGRIGGVSYSATGGTISPEGVYTAGSTAGTFRIISCIADTSHCDTSAVVVTVPLAPKKAPVDTGKQTERK